MSSTPAKLVSLPVLPEWSHMGRFFGEGVSNQNPPLLCVRLRVKSVETIFKFEAAIGCEKPVDLADDILFYFCRCGPGRYSKCLVELLEIRHGMVRSLTLDPTGGTAEPPGLARPGFCGCIDPYLGRPDRHDKNSPHPNSWWRDGRFSSPQEGVGEASVDRDNVARGAAGFRAGEEQDRFRAVRWVNGLMGEGALGVKSREQVAQLVVGE